MTPESFYRRKGAPFGYSDDYDGFHTGKDYEWAGGTTIPAFANGRVVQKGWTNIHGWYASLFIAGMYWHFCHMQSPATAPLGEIRKGDTIGRVGTTGLSTGNHLHLARSTNITPGYGVRTDPVPAVNELLYNTDPSGGGITPIPTDWLDMASEAEVRKWFREELDRSNSYPINAVRREGRLRWVKNHDTNQHMLVSWHTGVIRDCEDEATAIRLRDNHRAHADPFPFEVSDIIWSNMRGELTRLRAQLV